MLKIETRKGFFAGAVEEPFENEREIEDYLAANPDLLGLERIVARQRPSGDGVPDLVGVDTEGTAVVVEIKAQVADRKGVLQLIRYLAHAEYAPDDFGMGETPPRVRGILIAPDVSRDAIGLSKRVLFDIGLYTIRKWRRGKKRAFLAERVKPCGYAPAAKRRAKAPSRGPGKAPRNEKPHGKWAPEDYADMHSEEAARLFLTRVGEIEKVVADEGLPLAGPVWRRDYAAFKTADGLLAAGVRFIRKRTPAYFFVVGREDIGKICPGIEGEPKRYRGETQLAIDMVSGRPATADIAPLIGLAAGV